MKRRGFLGFLGGAAVAGPSMAKQAAAETIADLSVGGGWVGSAVQAAWPGYGAINDTVEHDSYLKGQLAKLVGRTAAQHAFHLRDTSVHQLDPDLAACRSFSLSAKIRMQREREYWRQYHRSGSWLEAQIAGWLE